jgi:hypothetical protein
LSDEGFYCEIRHLEEILPMEIRREYYIGIIEKILSMKAARIFFLPGAGRNGTSKKQITFANQYGAIIL